LTSALEDGMPAHSRGASRATKYARVATVVILTLLPFALDAGQAQAHDKLVSTQPAGDSSITTGPPEIRLTFDKPVQTGFTEVEVTGPGSTYWAAGPPSVNGDTVTAPLRPLGPAGRYTIQYRIVSADGHPVSGQAGFTLAEAGSGAPAAGPVGPRSLSVTAAPTSAASAGGFPFWLWPVAGGAVLVLLGLLLARRITSA
jgi:methionine-rich copper-binding protein CopC